MARKRFYAHLEKDVKDLEEMLHSFPVGTYVIINKCPDTWCTSAILNFIDDDYEKYNPLKDTDYPFIGQIQNIQIRKPDSDNSDHGDDEIWLAAQIDDKGFVICDLIVTNNIKSILRDLPNNANEIANNINSLISKLQKQNKMPKNSIKFQQSKFSKVTFTANTTFNQQKSSDDRIEPRDDMDEQDPYSYDSRLQEGFSMMNDN